MGDYRIVSDVKRDRYNTESVKDFFIRRDFRNIVAELEKENNDGENIIINKALAYHVLGNYDEAKKYYAKFRLLILILLITCISFLLFDTFQNSVSIQNLHIIENNKKS